MSQDHLKTPLLTRPLVFNVNVQKKCKIKTHKNERSRPLPICNFNIRNMILKNVLPDDVVVKDVYSSVVGRPYDFWMLSGETPESFQTLI